MIIRDYFLLSRKFEDLIANEMRDRKADECSIYLQKMGITFIGPVIYLMMRLRGIKTPSDFDDDNEFQKIVKREVRNVPPLLLTMFDDEENSFLWNYKPVFARYG